MAVTVTHATVAVGTDAGNGEIRKSQWNANHTVTNAADISTTNTFADDQTISKSGAGVYINISGDSARQRAFRMQTTGTLRWLFGTNTTAESGSNAGTDFIVNRYDDSGTSLGSTFTITRSSGQATLEKLNVSSGNMTITGAGVLGYASGSGGAVTQLTSRTTGVTLNKPAGGVILFTAAGSTTATTFTVTNSFVTATDTIVLSVKSSTNVYLAFVTAVAAGSFNITFYTTGGTSSDSPTINFAIVKSVDT